MISDGSEDGAFCPRGTASPRHLPSSAIHPGSAVRAAQDSPACFFRVPHSAHFLAAASSDVLGPAQAKFQVARRALLFLLGVGMLVFLVQASRSGFASRSASNHHITHVVDSAVSTHGTLRDRASDTGRSGLPPALVMSIYLRAGWSCLRDRPRDVTITSL